MANNFQEYGVSTICALKINGNYVSKINGKFFMIYPWIEGRVFTQDDEITADIAQKIGMSLAKIHKINLQSDSPPKPILSYPEYYKWQDLAKKVQKLDCIWQNKCVDFIQNMASWYDLAEQSNINLQGDLLLSHKDLDMKNVIWDKDGEIYIIDWESVGYTNPTKELTQLAFDWSYGSEGGQNKMIFQKIFKAYSQINEIDTKKVKDVLYSSLGDNLGWLEFNLKRVLHEIKAEIEEVKIAEIEIPKTIDIISHRLKHLEKYVDWTKV
jgi:Ser/Thr protein kinase RdoA (MazF antagonist)